jgi:hypothetical protein
VGGGRLKLPRPICAFFEPFSELWQFSVSELFSAAVGTHKVLRKRKPLDTMSRKKGSFLLSFK